MLKDRLKELRTEYNMTQDELAKAIQRTRSSIAAYETGSKEPTIDTIILLSEFFHVTTDYLLGVSNERNYASFPFQNSNHYLKTVKLKYENLDEELKQTAGTINLTFMDYLLELQSVTDAGELSPISETTLTVAETHDDLMITEKEKKNKLK